MGRNIKYQLKTAVESNFTPGAKKHSIKKSLGTDNTRSYSYADRKNLIDFTANFSNWLKEAHNEIKLVKDIKSSHVQEFLNSKAKECSYATVKQYMSKANKMQNIINKTYGCNNKLNIEIPKSLSSKQVLRDQQMSVKDYEKIHSVMKIGGNGYKALEIGRNFGLRVSEIVKLQKRDIDIKKNEIRVIDAKGGRDRTVRLMTEDQVRVAKSLYNSVERDLDRIVPVRANSINMALNRAMYKLDIKNDYKETSFHSIRKLYAQEEYNRLRENGCNIKEACEKVSEQLGHSRERGNDKELISRYIKDIV
ncbi:MAG: tyrosine-type recombinase/integrase [Clostridium sp.]